MSLPHPRWSFRLHQCISSSGWGTTSNFAWLAEAWCQLLQNWFLIWIESFRGLLLVCIPVRLLEARVGPVFHNRGEIFKVVIFDKVRPWKDRVPNLVGLDNAYRPRKDEHDMIPHSFVFRRRESIWDLLGLLKNKWLWACTKASFFDVLIGDHQRFTSKHDDIFCLIKH